MGSVDVKLPLGAKPILSFKFIGKYDGISAVVSPTPTYSKFKPPAVVTDANTNDLTFGCAYTTGTLGTGTAYPSRGIEVMSGNDVKFTPLVGGDSVDIVQREMTGKIELELTAAQEVSLMSNVIANTTQSVGIQHGTAAGSVVILHAPTVQLLNPTKQDVDGRRMIGYDLRLVPSTGNDELRICVR